MRRERQRAIKFLARRQFYSCQWHRRRRAQAYRGLVDGERPMAMEFAASTNESLFMLSTMMLNGGAIVILFTARIDCRPTPNQCHKHHYELTSACKGGLAAVLAFLIKIGRNKSDMTMDTHHSAAEYIGGACGAKASKSRRLFGGGVARVIGTTGKDRHISTSS